MSEDLRMSAFRAEVRDWMKMNVPSGWRAAMTGADTPKFIAFQRAWMRTLVQGGLRAESDGLLD